MPMCPLLCPAPELCPPSDEPWVGDPTEKRAVRMQVGRGESIPQVALGSDFLTPEARGSIETDTLRGSVTPGYYTL